jgi:hypothetical protein
LASFVAGENTDPTKYFGGAWYLFVPRRPEMMDSVSGSTPSNVLELSNIESVDSAPPSSKPIAVSEVKPDVSVAISQMAQARMESMAAPSDASESETLSVNSKSGGMEFGVEKGGFDWPLNAGSETTAQAAKFDSEDAWVAKGEAVNGILNDAGNESAYIALGKSTVSASK